MESNNFAVIFDMDGVLIDSQPLHYEIDMRVLKACGYKAEMSTVTAYTGISTPDRWPKYKATLGLTPSIQELITMCEETVRKVFESFDFVPIDGVSKLLQDLKDMGMPIAVASSSSYELINMVLTGTGISEYFDIIVSGEGLKRGKPNPDIYLKAAELLNVLPQNAIGIEDSPAGMEAVKNANMTCIALKNPNTFGQIFTNAHYVINHFDECLNIVKKVAGIK